MSILAALLLILCGGLFLTIRSMKTLLKETRPTTSYTSQTFSSRMEPQPPLIVESLQELRVKLSEIITDQNNAKIAHLCIEKLFVNNSIIYAIYQDPQFSLWTNTIPEGYLVQDDIYLNTTTAALAHQYILSHQNSNSYLLSKRALITKPSNYILTDIDHTRWLEFNTKQHTLLPKAISKEKIIEEITSEAFRKERRTIN